MAYVLYTPPTHDAASFRPTDGSACRAIGRIVGPLKVGYTQYRIGGVWTQKAVPTTEESVAADVDTDGQVLFLRGGHWHFIREEIYDEIVAAGLTPGDVAPDSGGLYPSAGTYPSSSTYPGAA